MNKQNILLDYEDVLKSYTNKVTHPPIKDLLPIYQNSKLAEDYAYLVGKIMGDGNLDSAFTLRFIGKKPDLVLLKELLVSNFKVNPKRMSIRRKVAKGVSYILQVNYAYLGRILSLLGAPIGNKTQTTFKVPKWILENNTSKRRFLQAILEDELTTIKIEKCNYSVKPQLKLAKRKYLIDDLREFMEQVKEAIKTFGVECSSISKPNKSKNTDSWDLYFYINRNKKNILKFKEKIGFRLNQDKIERLNECCKIIKKTFK